MDTDEQKRRGAYRGKREAPTQRGGWLREKRSRKQLLCLLLGAVFSLTAAVSAILLGAALLNGWREERAFEELSRLTEADLSSGETDGSASVAAGSAEQESARFAALYARNSDFAGWLSIAGTAIDYPVMLTPDEPEYYLRRDFDKKKSVSGTPFIGAGCTLAGNNIIIYGHHMKNGTMFADLPQYADESFYAEHRRISFDTMEEAAEYEILADFYEKVHYQDETGVFRYYDYGGTLTETAFDEYIAQVQSAAIYDTGVTASYGDQLLTLSTCSYHTDNGRFVVVAKKLTESADSFVSETP